MRCGQFSEFSRIFTWERFLNRSYDTRQRDYRKADTDVGADVNETAGHYGPPDPLNRSHPLQPRKAAPVSLAAP